jgi:nitrogen fixation NifU-like protein
MTPEEEIFQALVQDHYRRPRQVGRLDAPPAWYGSAVNAACGDEISLWVQPEDLEIKFIGQGCAISQASASLMASKLRGKSLEEMQSLREGFVAQMRGLASSVPMGDLALFAQLLKFPARVACTLVAWYALEQALTQFAGAAES